MAPQKNIKAKAGLHNHPIITFMKFKSFITITALVALFEPLVATMLYFRDGQNVDVELNRDMIYVYGDGSVKVKENAANGNIMVFGTGAITVGINRGSITTNSNRKVDIENNAFGQVYVNGNGDVNIRKFGGGRLLVKGRGKVDIGEMNNGVVDVRGKRYTGNRINIPAAEDSEREEETKRQEKERPKESENKNYGYGGRLINDVAVRKAYEILKLEPGSDLNQVNRAYRKLALIYHPDKQRVASNPLDQQTATRKFQEINNAHETVEKYLSGAKANSKDK
jgi:hypothetical protein